MFWPRSWMVVAIACTALGASRPAAAEPDPRLKQARDLVDQGSKRFAAHDFDGALEAFQHAYAVLPNPRILFNEGRAALEAGRDPVAANAFAGFLHDTTPAPEIDPQRKEAFENLERLRRKLGRLELSVVPPGAQVSIDGAALARDETYVAPGSHEVRASAPGRTEQRRQVQIAAGESQTISLTLAPLPPPSEATLAPPVAQPPAAALTAKAPTHARPVAPWVLIGVGAASVAASGVFGALAASANSKLGDAVAGKPDAVAPSEIAGLRSQVRTDAWVSTATLGAGVIAAGIGVFLLVRHSGEPVATRMDAAGNPAVALRF